MLVLKRKVGEVVRIANDIEVHILAVEGDIIKLGFEAPKHIQILRSELYDEIKAENEQSVMSNDSNTKEMLKKLKFSNSDKNKN
ncbi:carbon storage regulator CsrA [Paenibacillus endoradicis]|uniref:carbon storage regulator CsrA n=1 Tax=Paenibacillus endoradicis TaxID=2972487 RepID=UPI0021590E42|nr:carbon storage regulator CsrA [Paenibacillus endoradicis]MCR8660505.1 carbon storage regulator CsrA [Paenibacillus endoradicis]